MARVTFLQLRRGEASYVPNEALVRTSDGYPYIRDDAIFSTESEAGLHPLKVVITETGGVECHLLSTTKIGESNDPVAWASEWISVRLVDPSGKGDRYLTVPPKFYL